MYFTSTRDNIIRQSFSAAVLAGLADDGGLFVPCDFPQIDLASFTADLSYATFAKKLLTPFLDAPFKNYLLQLCNNAFNFPIPLKPFSDNTFILELFHGPTSSFKDVGARFLAECLNIFSSKQKNTIMVATSGDTGSAVASAFYEKSNLNVIILYPKGKISKRQEQQIICWDKNILSFAVEGCFDDCQSLVKAAFKDPWWQQHVHLSSANSINIGRLLPQMTYYAYSSLQFYREHHTKPGFIIPTGNLGNATACYWAKAMGFPIREIVLATNANTVLSDYLTSGNYSPRPSIATLANAMDVGNPSNFERLQHLFNNFDTFKQNVFAISASDEAIRQTIKEVYEKHKTIICPHTATACFARKQLADKAWIIVATADPSKFETIIEPIIGSKIPIPPQLQLLLQRPGHSITIKPSLLEIQKKM